MIFYKLACGHTLATYAFRKVCGLPSIGATRRLLANDFYVVAVGIANVGGVIAGCAFKR